MALLVASYPDPIDPITPLANAYAWAAHIHLDMGLGRYWVDVWIHKNEAVASLVPPPDPLGRLLIEPGTVLVPGVAGVPAVEAIEADPDADPPVEAVEAVSGVDAIPAVLAPSLTEVFDKAAAAQVANPALTPLLAFKKAVYDVVSLHHQLSPNTVV